MSQAKIEVVEYPKDERGFVIEPIGADLLPQQRNTHLVVTKPGGVRANHYHLSGEEILVVIGPALARLREDGVIRSITVPKGEAYRFTIPAGVSHAVQNTGEEPMLLVSFRPEVFDRNNPGVVKDELI